MVSWNVMRLLVLCLLFPHSMLPVASEITSVSFLFETYSPYGLIRIFDFSDKDYNISSGCLQDMYTFLEGLKNGDLWSVKLYDANGLYSGGQYAGFNYRIHNPNICRDLQKQHLNAMAMHWSLKSNMTTVPFQVQLVLAKYLIEFNNDYSNYHEIHQMICFPKSCTTYDLDQILAAVIIPPEMVVMNMTYMGARAIPGDYNFTEDVSFYVLMTLILMIVVLFITTASCNHWMKMCDSETHSTIRRLKSVLKAAATNDPRSKRIANLKHIGLERAMEQFKKLSDYDLNSSKNFKQSPLDGSSLTFNNIHCKDYVNLMKVKKIKAKNLSTITLDIITEEGEIKKPLNTFSGEREILMKELFQSFALDKIVNNLAKQNYEDEELTVIRSLQTLCALSIILVNTYNHMEVISNNFGAEATSFVLEIVTVVREQTTYFIDMFFFLSGASLSYFYYKTSQKIESPHAYEQLLHLVGIIAYKICSIILTYTVILICLELSSKYFHNSTVLEIPSRDFMNCDLHKWKNVLFIDTFFPMEDRCMVWSWLISLEVQFFLIGSLILLLAQIHPKYAGLIFSSLLIFSMFAFLMLESDPMSIYFEEQISQAIWLQLNLVFNKVWLRILPYLLGMCLGYAIQKSRGKIKINRITAFFGWALCALIIGIYFYGLPLIINRINFMVRAAAITMSHVAWNMILSWIILASLSNYGGFLTTFFNSKILFTLGKITTTVVLLNPLIIRCVLLSGESGILLTGGYFVMMFIGLTITTYLLALLLHIFLEAPLLAAIRVVYQWQLK